MRFSGTRTLLLSLCAVLVAATAAFADGVADKVTINDPYVRAVPPVVKTTAAFMQIQNTDAVERFIVGASSPIASARARAAGSRVSPA